MYNLALEFKINLQRYFPMPYVHGMLLCLLYILILIAIMSIHRYYIIPAWYLQLQTHS